MATVASTQHWGNRYLLSNSCRKDEAEVAHCASVLMTTGTYSLWCLVLLQFTYVWTAQVYEEVCVCSSRIRPIPGPGRCKDWHSLFLPGRNKGLVHVSVFFFFFKLCKLEVCYHLQSLEEKLNLLMWACPCCCSVQTEAPWWISFELKKKQVMMAAVCQAWNNTPRLSRVYQHCLVLY